MPLQGLSRQSGLFLRWKLRKRLAAGPIVRYVTVAEELRCRRETLAAFSAQGGGRLYYVGIPERDNTACFTGVNGG